MKILLLVNVVSLEKRSNQLKYEEQKVRSLRACLHGGGGPQVGEVTHFGG